MCFQVTQLLNYSVYIAHTTVSGWNMFHYKQEMCQKPLWLIYR